MMRWGVLGMVLVAGMGCRTPVSDVDTDTDTDTGVDMTPLFAGPFVYDSTDEGVHLIDTLWIVTEEAVEEIAALGQTPEEYLNWRIDAMNATLTRSLVDTSIVRSLGVHVLTDHDLERTGVDIGQTDVNISTALSWLGSYRDTYGADKVVIVAGTEEGASAAALGGGDVSAHWVTFLPVEHEFGHQMGGSHCNEGDPEAYNFGFPVSGYDGSGYPIEGGAVSAGTRMCGNSVALFSNPDVWLTLEEIDEMIAQDLAPAGEWAALADDDGLVQFGDPIYANMAQQWRDVEADAAARLATSMYAGDAGEPYPKNDCVGLFSQEGYGGLIQEVCAGEEVTQLAGVSSIQLGVGVHANVYSDPNFGLGSMCGGQRLRLGYSSPSLGAMSAHHGMSPMDNNVGAVSVFYPEDREAHLRLDGPYTFHGAGTQPTCEGATTQELVLMPDNRDWTATAAVYETPVEVPFAVEFELRSFHDDADPPADGFTFFFGKSSESYAQTTPPRSQLGFVPDGTGYAFMINTWTRSAGLRDGNWETLGSDVSHRSYTEGAWVALRMEVREEEVVVYWDGTELHRTSVSLDTTHSTVGFTAGTGYYTVEYRLRDIQYTSL